MRRTTMMKYTFLIGWLTLATPLAQCAEGKAEAGVPAAAPGTTPTGGFAGKVLETMDAANYTYIQVDTGTNRLWAAAPRFSVKTGDQVVIAAGMPMEKYHSKTLDRDFDVVYFTDRVMVKGQGQGTATGAATLPKDHPPIGGAGDASTLPKDHPPIGAAADAPQLPKDHPPIGAAAAKLSVNLSGIQKAPGGKTVAEVWADKAKLAGKSITVRGRVVKYNPDIMGKNWLHIRDGTGEQGSNDLLVTSATEVKVGDTVLVTGLVGINKDFGANYKYAVMIEDAKVKVE